MSEFRTTVSISPSDSKIRLGSGIFTIGSCFADAIGDRLKSSKFLAMVNPFGVAYNPASIHKALHYAVSNERPADQSFLTRDEIHFNYEFHSSYSDTSKPGLMDQLGSAIGSSHHFVKDSEWIMITYGTAWIYKRNDNGEVVSNCHKNPSKNFSKSLMTADEIVTSFRELHASLKKFNSKLKVILTLSPVRHVKDSLELNSVSKAILRTACHALSNEFQNVEYFPAYEIMMDDLRDYRFYKSDMLHPSDDAENYIWEKFGSRYFDDQTQLFLKKWKSIQAALSHRPFHEHSPQHQQFVRETLQRLEELKTVANVNEEIATLKSKLV